MEEKEQSRGGYTRGEGSVQVVHPGMSPQQWLTPLCTFELLCCKAQLQLQKQIPEPGRECQMVKT